MPLTDIVWDAHTCFPLLPNQSLEGLERHRAAGVDYVCINVGMCMNPVSQVMHAIAGFRAWLAARTDRFALVGSVAEIQQAKAEGKLAVGFDLEGSMMLEDDVSMLALYRDLGVRQIHLAYNRDNSIGGGCHGADRGLTDLGRKVVAEINRIGLLMDCAHSGHRTSLEIMEMSTRPVVFSHANVRKLTDHPRNVTDDQIDACARTGGVVGVSGISRFIGGIGGMDISTEGFVRHVDALVQRVGARHVGIGLDYVFDKTADDLPPGVRREDWWPPEHYGGGGYKNVEPERFPAIADALLSRGYADEDVRGILGGNFARVAAATWL